MTFREPRMLNSSPFFSCLHTTYSLGGGKERDNFPPMLSLCSSVEPSPSSSPITVVHLFITAIPHHRRPYPPPPITVTRSTHVQYLQLIGRIGRGNVCSSFRIRPLNKKAVRKWTYDILPLLHSMTLTCQKGNSENCIAHTFIPNAPAPMFTIVSTFHQSWTASFAFDNSSVSNTMPMRCTWLGVGINPPCGIVSQ